MDNSPKQNKPTFNADIFEEVFGFSPFFDEKGVTNVLQDFLGTDFKREEKK